MDILMIISFSCFLFCVFIPYVSNKCGNVSSKKSVLNKNNTAYETYIVSLKGKGERKMFYMK